MASQTVGHAGIKNDEHLAVIEKATKKTHKALWELEA
jgi:hypothetical protein